ncbi:MAG: HAD hydrolase family protein [Eubacteriales bacterium]|nr:HAD hydrolase family protein [Eubacteriales bacterium]
MKSGQKSQKLLLCTDLDNTLIYSCRREIGSEKRCVELYQGREVSFITEETFRLLNELKALCRIIPVSTRTEEQYQRIELGIGEIPFALVCNGGILLINGRRDEGWLNESRQLVSSAQEELRKSMELLEKDARRKFELRFIEQLFVFTKCEDPQSVVAELKAQLKEELVKVFHNGEKVYVVPNALSKGKAIERLRSYLRPQKIIAAGDSEFDLPMVEAADLGFVPKGFCEVYQTSAQLREKEAVFSDHFLREVLRVMKKLACF